MDKAQALQYFWSGFGLDAYDEQTVPDDAIMPYITYQAVTDSLGSVVNLYASLWYKSKSWKDVTEKAEEIAKFIGEKGFYSQKINNGYVWFTKGSPFAQRMSNTGDDTIRRIYLNVQAEFLTAY